MDIKTLTDLITNFGFPMVCVIGLAYFVWVLYKQSVTREEKLMEVNAQAIETISKYADKLTIIEDDVKAIKNDVDILLTK